MLKRRMNALICRIDVTGFVGIQIFLLALFIADAAPHHYHGVTVELPKAHHSVAVPRADREDALIVAVTYDGKIYFAAQRFDEVTDLREKLQDALPSSEEKKVYIKADARARYREVREVLEQVRLAGIEKVVFIAGVYRYPKT